MSPYLNKRIIEHAFLGGSDPKYFYQPPNLWVGVLGPNPVGELMEPTGKPDYKRVRWYPKASFLPGRISNETEIVFHATAYWGIISRVGFWDAQRSGNLIHHAPL